uniref:Uncharacterized protein n=1 Tax=Arundo donax TaxID=35708 RepID=A0A0A8ZS37_ARUDO
MWLTLLQTLPQPDNYYLLHLIQIQLSPYPSTYWCIVFLQTLNLLPHQSLYPETCLPIKELFYYQTNS